MNSNKADINMHHIKSESIMEQNLEALRRLPAFKNIPIDIISLFALMAERKQYGKDEIIFNQGERISTAYLIVSGRVNLFLTHDNKHLDLEEISSGNFFGYMSLLASLEIKLSAIAAEHCEFITLDRYNFRKVMVRYPESCIKIVESLILQRMQRMEIHMKKLMSLLPDNDHLMTVARTMAL